MMISTRSDSTASFRVAGLAALFVAELLVLAVIYQFFAQIECHLTGSQATCDFLRSLVARALVVAAVAAILIRARPALFAGFLRQAANHAAPIARAVHFAGVALLLVPLVLAGGGDLGAIFGTAVVPWAVGAVLALVGGLSWAAPRQAWAAIVVQDHYALVPILLAAALVPDLAEMALPLWDWQGLTTATFLAVAGFLRLFSTAVEVAPAEYVIGVETFFVHIARQCSGVEGFALVTAFVALYAFVFRGEVRQVRFWLVVLPLGLALSWILNVVRIGTLVLIGAYLSPEVAVNGFHSYAGWLFFTVLAFTLIWFVQKAHWLHYRGPRGAVMPLRQDPVAAAIVPFAAFMVSSTFVAALFPSAGLGFPVNTLVLLCVTAAFLPVYRQLAAWPEPVSLILGAAVGVMWVVTAPEPDLVLEMAVATMPFVVFAIWAGLRVVGTIIFVPLVEEMFFRGYLLRRLGGPKPWQRVLAIMLSSMAFALLHGRWIEAGLAGIAFAAMTLRRGRVSDAVWGHIVSNAIVAGVALAQREWSLI